MTGIDREQPEDSNRRYDNKVKVLILDCSVVISRQIVSVAM